MMFNEMMHDGGGDDVNMGSKGYASAPEVKEMGGSYYMKGADGKWHIAGERGLVSTSPEFVLVLALSSGTSVYYGAKALYSSFVRSTGGRKTWFRIGPSKSRTGNFMTKKSIRWWSNSHYRKSIGNPTLRKWNEQLHNTKLPGNNWRVNDRGHFHWEKE